MTKEAMDRLINQAHPLPRRRLKAYELPAEKYADGPGMDLEGQLEASIEWVENQKRSMNEKKGITPMSEKLRLEKNIWAEIALRYTDGKDFSNESLFVTTVVPAGGPPSVKFSVPPATGTVYLTEIALPAPSMPFTVTATACLKNDQTLRKPRAALTKMKIVQAPPLVFFEVRWHLD